MDVTNYLLLTISDDPPIINHLEDHPFQMAFFMAYKWGVILSTYDTWHGPEQAGRFGKVAQLVDDLWAQL